MPEARFHFRAAFSKAYEVTLSLGSRNQRESWLHSFRGRNISEGLRARDDASRQQRPKKQKATIRVSRIVAQ
jgi:hypothetical protein